MIDTVVFVRPLITPRSRWGRILFQLVDQYTMVLSPQIVEEILDVLYRPGLRQRFPQMASPPELALVLGLLSTAEVVEPRVQLSVRRDPGDNKFLECAVEGAADCIVTENRDLLDLAARPKTAHGEPVEPSVLRQAQDERYEFRSLRTRP